MASIAQIPAVATGFTYDEECKLLRVREVVALTGWSTSDVYARARGGELPSVRRGRSVRIPLIGLRRYIASHTCGGSQSEE